MRIDPSILAEIPSLARIPEPLARSVLQNARLKHYRTGETLATRGASADTLFYVVSGCVSVVVMAEDGRLVGQSPANPGDPIGWLSVIDGKPMNASLVAAVDSAVLLIPSAIARELLLPEPSVNQFVLLLLARGIRQHLDERRVLTLPNAFQRVFLHLHQLAQSAQAEGAPMLPKQQDIATSVNTSRETVSRAIQLLVKRGVLHKRGHQVVILQHDQLKALANAASPAGPNEASGASGN